MEKELLSKGSPSLSIWQEPLVSVVQMLGTALEAVVLAQLYLEDLDCMRHLHILISEEGRVLRDLSLR